MENRVKFGGWWWHQLVGWPPRQYFGQPHMACRANLCCSGSLKTFLLTVEMNSSCWITGINVSQRTLCEQLKFSGVLPWQNVCDCIRIGGLLINLEIRCHDFTNPPLVINPDLLLLQKILKTLLVDANQKSSAPKVVLSISILLTVSPWLHELLIWYWFKSSSWT